MSKVYAALIACLLVTTILAAQLKVDVALVNLVATVTDQNGRYVPDLTANDLIVEEDGQVQTISHFDLSDDLPVSVGLVLDTSGSMERKIATALSSVERFLRSIHEDDDVFLMTFSERPNLRQDFTDDRERLTRALRQVSVGGGTALYDAVEDSLRKIKRGKHEKKAIILISDGEDTSSYATFDDALGSVRESELLVYGLGISPAGGIMSEGAPRPRSPSIGNPFPWPGIPGIPGGGGRRWPLTQLAPQQFPQRQGRGRPGANPDTVDMSVLNAFADASGGKAWLLSGTWSDNRGNAIQNALDEIAAELRNQYGIGYYPTHPLNDGKWHRIEVRAKNPKYHVRARKEYFGK